MNYENKKDRHLMAWEENPKKRNVNNEIKFNIPENTNIQIRDNPSGGRNPCYEIQEIFEIIPSSFCGFNYVTAKTKWYVE